MHALGSRPGRAAGVAILLALLAIGFAVGLQVAPVDRPALRPPPTTAGPPPLGPPPPPATEPAALRTPTGPTVEDVAHYVPLYRQAGRRFGVNWLLLASIHAQETAFSTASDTYHGRNFAGCCAGPMQFNVRDGDPTMWQRFGGAFRLDERPASYPHPTARHPSVYDDFDAIMASAWLMHENGAGAELDGAAWSAAYQYYGPGDVAAVDYANQVLARATAWGRDGFDPATPLDSALVAEFESDYGGALRAQLTAAAREHPKKARHSHSGSDTEKPDKEHRRPPRRRSDPADREPQRQHHANPPQPTPEQADELRPGEARSPGSMQLVPPGGGPKTPR